MRFGVGVALLSIAAAVAGAELLGEADFAVTTAESAPRPSLRRPLPEVPGLGQSLPPPSTRDHPMEMTIGPNTSRSGSAFAVGVGVWMTARHVADGCSEIGIVTGPHRIVRGHRTESHPSADIAIFRAQVLTEPLVPGGLHLRIGDPGYQIGFPQGEPGAARSLLLGRGTIRMSGRFSLREPVLAWAMVERWPDIDKPLSGMSGGPTFDASGRFVGAYIGHSTRRARLYTNAPQSILELFARAAVPPSNDGAVTEMNEDNYLSVGDRLRNDLIVVKVACQVY